jgi:hypothetical protein
LILSGVSACEYSHIPRHPTLPATANRPARPARTEERWTENQPTRRIVVVSSHIHRTWLRNPGFRRTVQLAPESCKVPSPSIAHSTVTAGTAEFGWDGGTTQDAKRMRGHKSRTKPWRPEIKGNQARDKHKDKHPPFGRCRRGYQCVRRIQFLTPASQPGCLCLAGIYFESF